VIHFDSEKKLFHLFSKHTSYVFGLSKSNHLIHYYYGDLLSVLPNKKDFFQTPQVELGSATSVDETTKENLNHLPLEFSTYGKGDYKDPTLHLELEDGYRTVDLVYQTHAIVKNLSFKGLPQTTKEETLKVTLADQTFGVIVNLYYTVLDDVDIIVRNLEVTNQSRDPFTLDKVLSMSLDFLTADYDLITLDGAWVKERHITRRPLHYGITKIDSKKGVSSSDHNPFVALLEKDASNHFGSVYGFNFIYSGNFEANFEVSPHDLLRVNMGINSFDFKWQLLPNETFTTPEVIMTYSHNGLNKMSQNMHDFMNHHFIKNRNDRPIMINNWEATYFDFNEKKLLAIAKQAKKLGIECFCLDDGWFGRRDDDTSSLGDWHEHPKKLSKGIEHLSKKIKKLGLDFGLWVEPEMVNPDSELFRNHPDWVIAHPKTAPALGRNQLLLDLSKNEVVDYLFETLKALFSRAEVSYVKWDMNRNFSDIFSQGNDKATQGKFIHLYTLGLYRLLDRLKQAFPKILFESCASGGNRFDLGIHYYMPQAWTSDNTDAYERLKIQSGTALAYPLSVISNHVNSDIAHQTIRHIPLETRFNVAAFGILGYELDLRQTSAFDKKVIKKQTAYYKEHRQLFQQGRFYNLSKTPDDYRYLVVNKDHSQAILGLFQGLHRPNPGYQKVKLYGLDPNKTYRITGRIQYENLKRFGALIHNALPLKIKPFGNLFNTLSNHYLFKVETTELTVKGDILLQQGISLSYRFTSSGYDKHLRILPDFSSRLYMIEEI